LLQPANRECVCIRLKKHKHSEKIFFSFSSFFFKNESIKRISFDQQKEVKKDSHDGLIVADREREKKRKEEEGSTQSLLSTKYITFFLFSKQSRKS
jgi:hypothetical protein